MELKILGFSFRLEIVILCIFFLYLMYFHLFFACSKITPKEGFEILKNVASKLSYNMKDGVPASKCGAVVREDYTSSLPKPDGKTDFYESV